MLKLTKTSYIDFDKYMDSLTQLGYVYVDLDMVKDAIKELDNRLATLSYLCTQIMITKSGYGYTVLKSKGIIDYLKNVEKCPADMFINKKTEGESLNSKSVLEPLLERGYATEFITMYMEYTSTKSVLGLMKGLELRAEETELVNSKGRPLYKVYFNLNEADNLRVYTKDFNIQGIPKQFSNCLVAPNDYIMVSGDFAQSDLRIAYSMMLRDSSNVKTMLKYDDKYEGLSRILMGNDFDLEEFKEHRNTYKANALAPIYGATTASTKIGTEYVKKAIKYLEQCPVYMEYRRRLKRRLDLGLPLKVTSYFGNSQVIEVDSYGYRGRNNKTLDAAKMNKALNTPIQTGTSEIVISCCNSVMKDFADLGITPENGGVYAYLNRHDELVFLLHKEHLNHSYIFQKHQVIQVDNWIPLEIKFSYSKAFNEVDEKLTEMAEMFYKPEIAQENLSAGEYSKMDKEDFYVPCPDVLELCVGVAEIPGTTTGIISYFDYINNKCTFDLCKELTSDNVYNSIISTVFNNLPKFKEKDINCVYVCTQVVSSDKDLFNEVLLHMTRDYEAALNGRANTLASYMAMKYCNKNNIPYNPSATVMNSRDYCEAVIRNGDSI